MRRAGFTLPELLIGLTVSALVMTAVAAFLGSGIDNAFRIRKALVRSDSGAVFDSAIANLQNLGGTLLYSGAFSAPYGTGVLLENLEADAPITALSVISATGVCNAFSGTVADPGPKGHLVLSRYFMADSGASLSTPGAGGTFTADPTNDRVLFSDGTSTGVFLDRSFGIRFPRSVAVSGSALLVAEGHRVLSVADSPDTGSSFSATANAGAGISFDSASVSILPSAGTLPSASGSYTFAGTNPTTVAAGGSSATLTFSGGVAATGNTAFSIAMSTPPAAAGSYAVRIVLQNAGTTVFDQTFPYFTKGDGNLATMAGNTVTVVADGLPYPNSLTSGGTFANGIADPANFPLTATPAETDASDRIVENFRTSVTGNILTASYTEYVQFDCVSGRHVKRDRVLKIPLR
jgi:prepilin-type N-terminal cleavage/methylation domain-containing protein